MRFQAVRMPRFVSVFMCLAALAVATSVRAATVEEIFAAARNYTVFIETRIETPFIEDDAGSYLGAGFIVDRDRGWVMTNAHVVGHSPATVDVSFASGGRVRATPVYIDSFLDLALIRLPPAATQAHGEANLDCAHRPDIGAPVGAYGHPNGYRFTGTRGIVSGFSMRVGSSGLQTDAPINAGNSGGPLIRLDTGTVVGINTQSLIGKHVQNMNFAVEATYACHVLTLLQQGRDPRPPALDTLFYNEGGEPTLIVAKTGPRATASGLEPGDQIIAVDGQPLAPANLAELTDHLRGVQGFVFLGVKRVNDQFATIRYPVEPDGAVMARRGFQLAGALIAPSLYQDAGMLVDKPRLMVHSVAPGSAAEAAGLEPFDMVVAVNGQPVASVDELAHRAIGSIGNVEFDVVRLHLDWRRFTRLVRVELPTAEGRWVALEPADATVGATSERLATYQSPIPSIATTGSRFQ